MSDEKHNAWLEFFGKLITPFTIIILVLIFKPTVEERLSQASEVSVLGSNFKFDTNSFHGQLSAFEVYYLIHASLDEALINFDLINEKIKAAVYLLQSKKLIQVLDYEGELDIEGDFKRLKIEPNGVEVLENLGVVQ